MVSTLATERSSCLNARAQYARGPASAFRTIRSAWPTSLLVCPARPSLTHWLDPELNALGARLARPLLIAPTTSALSNRKNSAPYASYVRVLNRLCDCDLDWSLLLCPALYDARAELRLTSILRDRCFFSAVCALNRAVCDRLRPIRTVAHLLAAPSRSCSNRPPLLRLRGARGAA